MTSIEIEFFFFVFQRINLELNQTLRLPVEQAIHNGKRMYTPPDHKDNSGLESAGMYVRCRREEEERGRFFLSSSSSLSFVPSFNHWMS